MRTDSDSRENSMATYEGVKDILSRTFSISIVETRWKETNVKKKNYNIGNKWTGKKKKKNKTVTNTITSKLALATYLQQTRYLQ
jgi:hypothetical protein